MKQNTETITPRSLLAKKKRGEKIVSLTAYDFTTARIADEADIDIILVGDSLGNVFLGHENTLSVTLDNMMYHTAAVSRAVTRGMVVADMPFLTYGISMEESLRNAGTVIKEAGAHGVKIEGATSERCGLIKALVDLGVPVLGHIGITPQHVLAESGYHIKGRRADEAVLLVEQAQALEKSGAFALVLECIQSSTAKQVTEAVQIPTIGIGSGSYCDGQILVSADILGLSTRKLRFVKEYANIRSVTADAFAAFRDDVRNGAFPSKDHQF